MAKKAALRFQGVGLNGEIRAGAATAGGPESKIGGSSGLYVQMGAKNACPIINAPVQVRVATDLDDLDLHYPGGGVVIVPATGV